MNVEFRRGTEFFSKRYPDQYQWRNEERIPEALKEIEEAPSHQADVEMIIEKAEKSIREQNDFEKK